MECLNWNSKNMPNWLGSRQNMFLYVCTVIFAELGRRIEDQARYLLSILIGGEEGMEMGGHGIRYSVIAILLLTFFCIEYLIQFRISYCITLFLA